MLEQHKERAVTENFSFDILPETVGSHITKIPLLFPSWTRDHAEHSVKEQLTKGISLLPYSSIHSEQN